MMTPTEIAAFQGMPRIITKLLLNTNPGEANFGRAIGDAMSLNVLMRLFVKLLPYVGLATQCKLKDRWGTGMSTAGMMPDAVLDRAVRKLIGGAHAVPR
jgi:hypothetical protein